MNYPEWVLTNYDDLQIVLFFGFFFLLAIAERLAPRVSDLPRRLARWPANLVLTLLNIVMLSALPLSFIATTQWTESNGWGLLHMMSLPLPFALAAGLLLRGFISFWTHSLMHRIPLFWRVHRVHHLDTKLDASTTVRFHPLEFVIGLGIGLPLVLALGFNPWVLAFYELLDVIVNLFSHSNIRLPSWLNRIVRYVLVTPDLHRVHHSTWWRESNSNFSAVFPVWDIIFGTFRPELRNGYEGTDIGIKEVRDSRSNDLLWLLSSPLASRLSDHSSRQPGERSLTGTQAL